MAKNVNQKCIAARGATAPQPGENLDVRGVESRYLSIVFFLDLLTGLDVYTRMKKFILSVIRIIHF